MNLTIKKLRTFRGMEGEGFSLDLYIDGRLAGEVYDDARGGEFGYRVSHEDHKALLAYAASLPDKDEDKDEEEGGHKLSPETMASLKLDCLMDELVAAAQEEKTIRRWIKTKVVYRRKGDKKGSYATVAPPKGQKLTPAFVAAQCERIRKAEGDKLECIYNEKYAETAKATR